MAESRVKCINSDCSNMIQLATAKRNDGVCGYCYRLRAEVERAEHIQRNRRTVDLFEGVTDPTDILRIAHMSKPLDPLISYTQPPRSIEELYSPLSLAQAEAMMTHAAEQLVGRDQDAAKAVAEHLGAFTSYNLDRMLDTWVSKRHFSPAIAFRAAGADICRRVLQSLEDPQTTAHHALKAAAWIGSDEVVRAFIEFDKTNPPWASSLYVKPSAYAHHAGWEIVAGKRRELSFAPCYAIDRAGAQAANPGIHVFEGKAETCTRCGQPLAAMISLDTNVQPLSRFQLFRERLEVITCHYCVCYEAAIFAKWHEDGSWRLFDRSTDTVPKFNGTYTSAWANAPVRLIERSNHHGGASLLTQISSQIGGLPGWVQQPDYPTCPSCQMTMVFLAQIDNGQFAAYEGTCFAFICQPCMITATTYQQT